MKIKIDYAQAAEILKTSLKMKGSPVAVGFATTKDDIPPGIPELDKTIKHCMMVGLARNEGGSFIPHLKSTSAWVVPMLWASRI